MKKKSSLFLASLIAVSGFTAACSAGGGDSKDAGSSSNSSGGSGDSKQVLNLYWGSDIPSMDSSLATDQVSFDTFNQVMEGLYTLDKDDKAIPGVAEGEPEISKDGKTWTIKLRKDAKWSNGDPVTAKDFEFAWKRTVDPKTAAEYAYIMYDVKNAEAINSGKMKPEELGIKAIDDNTLEIQLEKNVPYFKELLAFATFLPQNEKFVKEKGDKYGTTKENTLYNGPFVLNEWKTEEKFQLVPNKEYWDKDKVKLDEVNYAIIKDQQTSLNLYTTGKLDRVGLTAEQVSKYKKDPDFSTELQSSVYFIRINQQKNKDLQNKNLRLALAKSIDKEKYVKTLLNNGAKATDYLTPGEFTLDKDGKDFNEGVKSPLNYDKEEAKKAYETAKKELGKDKFNIELLTYDADTSKKDAEYFKEQIETNLPGTSVTIKQQPFKQKLDLESKGNYDISFAGWGPDYPDPMTFLDMFVTDGPHNQTGYSNKEYDQLIDQARGPLLDDTDKRWTTMQEAENKFLDDAVIIPMFQKGVARLTQPHVKNFVTHKFGGDTTLKETYVEGKK
ncbi:peptide ABC transporter substrate-binding protein [Macrococcus hajekii]|uniref:Periplasmic oligopeptide-binding protein OppA n=1 Tax=Macrococcus hajekii TaxID=198482 RepID=A0A4R6BNT2_9STAP|nr:peptide ABC transporter substrate-binding protein [Macrococcus hajekii]TDM03438.1 peptide ABC transporter substrate-binding protein [Macrococcus hajekii]GGA98870.1 peptide ABC transporter substrate-binding protein [Macrococcus hajekii]